MCGRYGRRGDKQYIAEHYRLRDLGEKYTPLAPSYNITPDSFQPVVRLSHETGERELALMKWGLVPRWAKTPKANFSSINARSDKLESSGAWREPFRKQRCLIPAQFFFEWEVLSPEERKRKVSRPWAVALTDDRLFSFGGIWEWWKDRETGNALESFSIITTDPNEVLKPFHNRCPLIIGPQDYERWLTPYEKDDPSTVPSELVRTYPAEGMKAWRVAPLKGYGPELLNPLSETKGTSAGPLPETQSMFTE